MAVPAPQTSLMQSLDVLLIDGGFHLVEAIVILCVGWVLATYIKRWARLGLARLPLDVTLKPLLAELIRYVILMITLLLVLEQFGVQTASLIAVLGAAGLAIGLAIQGTLSNVASGVMLLILRPFRVGHFVEIGGQQGTVREIGLFTTVMTTRDHIYVSMPNSSIFSAIIINYTREPLRRVKFEVPVDRANDLDKVEKTILAALAANRFCIEKPEPTVVVRELQEYTAVMRARAFVRSNDYWQAIYAMQKEVQAALNGAEILLPVNRQAPVVRNEPLSPLTAPAPLAEAPAPALSQVARPAAPRSAH